MLKNLFFLAGFSTFVVIVIVGLDIYQKIRTSTLSPTTQRNVIPIDNTFDTQTLEGLKTRNPLYVNLSERSSIISENTRTTTPTPTTQPTDTGSESARIIP